MNFQSKTIPSPGNLPDARADVLRMYQVSSQGGGYCAYRSGLWIDGYIHGGDREGLRCCEAALIRPRPGFICDTRIASGTPSP
jgi:hypothetical protein